ncbi:hypothetical protein OSTOST_06084, partial [Ostertagia ostertagi]
MDLERPATEKLEKPMLESLARKPNIPDPLHNQSEVADNVEENAYNQLSGERINRILRRSEDETDVGFSTDGASNTQGSEESDMELDVTPPPSEERQALGQKNGHDATEPNNEVISSKREKQCLATPSTRRQNFATTQINETQQKRYNLRST